MKQVKSRLALIACLVALGCSQQDPDASATDGEAGSDTTTAGSTASSDSTPSGSDAGGTSTSVDGVATAEADGSAGDDVADTADGDTGDSDAMTAGTTTTEDAGDDGAAGDATADTSTETDAGGWPDETSHFPIVEGAEWTYRHEGGSTVWDEKVTVQADGDVMLLVDSQSPSGSSSRDTLGLVGSSVMRVSKIELTSGQPAGSVIYDPGFTRFDTAWLTREVGYSETLNYARQEWDATGALVKDGERSHTFVVEETSVEVEVPAGTFTDCLVIFRQRERTDPANADDGDDKRYWFCRGVGKVKEVEPESGKTESLVSCSVPGGACP